MNTKKYIIAFLILLAVIIGAIFFIFKKQPTTVENLSVKNSTTTKNKIFQKNIETQIPASFSEINNRVDNFKNLIGQKINQDKKNIDVQIGIEDDNYASGIFTVINEAPSDATNLFLAIKNNDKWQIVWTGQNNFSCEIIQQYNIPEKIASDCK